MYKKVLGFLILSLIFSFTEFASAWEDLLGLEGYKIRPKSIFDGYEIRPKYPYGDRDFEPGGYFNPYIIEPK